MEEGKRQGYGNALLGVHHQEEEEYFDVFGLVTDGLQPVRSHSQQLPQVFLEWLNVV